MTIETFNKIENNIQKSVLKTITEIDSYSNKQTKQQIFEDKYKSYNKYVL